MSLLPFVLTIVLAAAGTAIINVALKIQRRRYYALGKIGIAPETFAGFIALALIIGMIILCGFILWRYLLTGEQMAVENMKTVALIFTPMIASALTYYFK